MLLTCPVCQKEFEYAPRPGRPPITCGDPTCWRIHRTRKTLAARGRLAATTECPPDKHGTSTGYNEYKCGCPECSRWARMYRQKLRKEAAAAGD
jgi:hypothetical protein